MISNGLDPALGFLHQDYPGRDSLMLDVTEIFRAAVDDFMLHWLHETELEEGSFYFRESEGCRLSKSARPLFYQAWGARRYRWPRPFREEVVIPVGEDEDTDSEEATLENGWPVAWLPEILNGQVRQLREHMKTITGEQDEITGTGDGAGGTESGVASTEE